MTTTKEAPSKTDELTGKVTILAYRVRTQLPVTVRPMMDRSGKLWTGQGKHGYYELLTDKEKSELPFVFDHESSYNLEDGKVLNLDDPYDKALSKWLFKSPYLALDKKQGEGSREVSFYLANPSKEATMRVDATEKIDDARYQVRKLSKDEQIHAARVLGLGAAESFPANVLLDWLLNKSNSNPEMVLSAINPANRARANAKIFFNDAVKWSVIERLKDGGYWFGGESGVSLGHNEDIVLDYLLAPENTERIKAMKAMLGEKTKTVIH